MGRALVKAARPGHPRSCEATEDRSDIMPDMPKRKPSVSMRDVHIANTPVGISAVSGTHIVAGNVNFNNVEKPFDFHEGVTGEVRNTKIRSDPKLSRVRASVSGWRRPHGPPLPVFCPQCKLIFSSQNYIFGGQFWLLSGNREQCTACD